MTIKLFHSPASPYVRKVLVTAHERGVFDQVELLESAAWPVKRDPIIVKHNASGKVPCLLTEDDQPVFDSRVICMFIDSLGDAQGTVYPSDTDRFRILTLEALAESVLDACLLCRYEVALRPEGLRWQLWHDSQMEKIDSGLDALEGEWFYLLSRNFNAGSIAAACTLGYLDFRFVDKDWRARHPRLTDWFAEISKRKSMEETMPKG